MSKAHGKLTVCPNCDTVLGHNDNFCPNCGQENHEVKLPLSHIIYEFVESITHFDDKLWNTLKAIFTQPGKMTAEFLEGKRMRYVPPARLYVFVSVIFFFLTGKFVEHRTEKQIDAYNRLTNDTTRSVVKLDLDGLINNDSLLETNHLQNLANKITIHTPLSRTGLTNSIRALKRASPQTLDSLLNQATFAVNDTNRAQLRHLISLIPDKPTIELETLSTLFRKKFKNVTEQTEFEERLATMSDSQVDSLIRAEGDNPTWISRKLYRQQGKLTRLGNIENANQLLHTITKNISGVMFILMPFVAVLLLFFYYRRGRYYYEHLIFSVHLHTVLFLLFSLAILLTYFASDSLAASALTMTFWISWLYFLLSLKRVYQQNWGRTILKFFALSLFYGFTAMIFVAGASFAGILTF